MAADQHSSIPPRSASGLGTGPFAITSSLGSKSSPEGERARGLSAPGSYQPMTQAIMTGQRGHNCYNRALYPGEEELSNVPRRIDYLNGRDRLQILPKLSLDGSISLPTSTLPTLCGISVS